jgi:hypothetical protein
MDPLLWEKYRDRFAGPSLPAARIHLGTRMDRHSARFSLEFVVCGGTIPKNHKVADCMQHVMEDSDA